MDDLISKTEAITLPVMPKEYREYKTQNLDDAYEQGWDDLQKCIESLPPAKQWIPCSERLPEKPDTYIATLDYGKLGLGVGQRYYYDVYLGWNDDCVIAWAPLPEPYKGGKQ